MAHEVTRSTNATRRGSARIALVAEGDRLRAFKSAERHSLLVRVLKLALPVLAVGSAGTLFLSPTVLLRLAKPTINASVGAVEVTTDQLRMVNPRFDGETADKGRYVVTANAAVQSLGNTDVMQLETVHGHLIQFDKSWTDLTSKSGTFWTKTKAMRLTDGIVITTSSDVRAELDHADIDTDKKIVTSDAAVAMTMPNGKLRGIGLLVDNTTRRVVLQSAVTAHLMPPKRPASPSVGDAPATAAPGRLSVTPTMSDGPVDISAKQLEILDNAKTATFTGAVEAVQSGTTVHSDRMEVGYATAPGGTTGLATPESAAQNVSYVTNVNNVVIATLDGRKATCQQSRYDRNANTMTLLGSVVLSEKASQVRGDSVVYDMTARKTRVMAKNRISAHFEPDAVHPAGSPPETAAASSGLAALGSQHGATDISADGLEISNADNQAVFRGTVIVSQRGNKLTGDLLTIDMDKRHMTMNGPGRVSGSFEATAGTGGAPKPLKTVAGGGSVPAPGIGGGFTSLAASNGQPTKVEADALTVEDDRGEATFTGDVVVVRGGDRISSGTLIVSYAGGGTQSRGPAQLARIRANDHVVVHTPSNEVVSSDALLYEPNRNLLTMSGNVTISQNQNVVHGSKLVVNLVTGEAQVQPLPGDGSQVQAAPGSDGRPSLLIFPQSMPQPGKPNAAKPPVAAADGRPKQEMSASDVMVAPDSSQ